MSLQLDFNLMIIHWQISLCKLCHMSEKRAWRLHGYYFHCFFSPFFSFIKHDHRVIFSLKHARFYLITVTLFCFQFLLSIESCLGGAHTRSAFLFSSLLLSFSLSKCHYNNFHIQIYQQTIHREETIHYYSTSKKSERFFLGEYLMQL